MSLKKILVLPILLLIACAANDVSRPGEPTPVVLWEFGGVPGLREWVRQAVEDFNATHGDIQVELEFRDWATQRESLIKHHYHRRWTLYCPGTPQILG